MKKIISILAAITLLACSEKSNDYVYLQGKINNTDIDTLTILGKSFKKEIKVNQDGTFKDTLKVVDGFHGFNDGKQQSFLYLKNGYDLELNFDAENFPESIEFKGEGSATNNYLGSKLQLIRDENLNNYTEIFKLEQTEFKEKVAEIKSKVDGLLSAAKGIDQEVIDMETKANNELIAFFETNYEKEHAAFVTLKKGEASPNFNYTDTEGKMVSLEDFRGKYVFIDIWATWCAPCKREFPFLKEMEHEYKDKDLAIISLSIDKMEHKERWLNMIENENLTGIQLLADNEWNSDFISAYNIRMIPRFILLDKNGIVIDANAPNPSNPALREILNDLEL